MIGLEKIQGKNLEIADNINMNVDGLDSMTVSSSLFIADTAYLRALYKESYAELFNFINENQADCQIVVYLLGPKGTKKRAYELAEHSLLDPEGSTNHLAYGTLYVKNKGDNSKMCDITSFLYDEKYNGVSSRWTSKASYSSSGERLSFENLNKTYAIVFFKWESDYHKEVNDLFFTDRQKTRVYTLFPEKVPFNNASTSGKEVAVYVGMLEKNDNLSGDFACTHLFYK